MNTREEIGKRIYELRRYFKITQNELCEGICTQAYISKIENGSLAIAADILFQIAERLGVDINYFYDSSYNSRIDYSLEVELLARELVERDDYDALNQLIIREEKTPLMENKKFKQFILWHKSLCKRFLGRDFPTALKLLDEALALFNTSSKVRSEREIQILINKANVYVDIEEYNQAIKYYKEADSYIKKLPYLYDKSLIIMVHYNLARTNLLNEDYERAIKYAEDGILQCKKQQSFYGFGQLYFVMGIANKKSGRLIEALEMFNRAKPIFEIIDNSTLYTNTVKAIEDVENELVETT
ncbi:helix-turn-helix domain-containing protein [Tenuibacillus multivorans]|uniref:Tetratricopeptide repeat-containing protein n=1 Tax=Tenuibacillus multivorans TaxID=237069 RepID=A0A1G9WNP7_9BACI|nr:helix-turn-helix domain-containing protein [Tenuibacillus multivorans]GEL77995.1 transcriptional regulator [Tenuibacillus multivorans]SDM86007.1 Tetratricopeptide repeat-containing protein [Tenuibacillus multivorans]